MMRFGKALAVWPIFWYSCQFGCDRVTDAEAVAMSRYLVHHDGLFLGSSSACNLVACIRLAKKMRWKNKERIVTILYACSGFSLVLSANSCSVSGAIRGVGTIRSFGEVFPYETSFGVLTLH